MRLTGAVTVAAFVAASLANSPSAIASGDTISSEVIGGLCIPDSKTVREGIYETAGFGVRFSHKRPQAARVAHIRLLCPFHHGYDLSAISSITMSFIDADGMGIGARVRAHLRRVQKGSNAAVTIGTCDSNTSNNTDPQQLVCKLPATHSTLGHNSYWFEIEIESPNPAVYVEFLGVGTRRP